MAAVPIHVVRVGLYSVDETTNIRIDKGSINTTINQLKNTKQEFLVIPDAIISSSANYPTIKAYLEAEALLGYKLSHMDQTMIVTYI